MTMTRRDLAAAGALALGAAAFIPGARADSGDEAGVKKTVDEMKTAYLKQDKAKLEAMTLPQLMPWIGGPVQFEAGFSPLICPIDDSVASQMIESDAAVIDAAVKHAHAAFLKHRDATTASSCLRSIPPSSRWPGPAPRPTTGWPKTLRSPCAWTADARASCW